MTKQEKINTILKEYDLDFQIEKCPLIAIDSEGNQIITPYFGLRNTKTNDIINTCKAGYTVSQNYDVLDMVFEGVEKFGDELEIAKAGSIHDGRRIFIQLKIKGNSVFNNDVIERYITILDSNDGTTGLSVGISDITLSCSNQFHKFYKAGEAKFRHTATLKQKIETIPSLIETALSRSIKQIEIYKKFVSTPLTKNLADKMVNYVLGYDRTYLTDENKLSGKSKSMMLKLYSHIDEQIKDKGNNLWGLHSGVTSWTTHEKSGPKRENGYMESLLIGAAYKSNQKSFEFAAKKINELVD